MDTQTERLAEKIKNLKIGAEPEKTVLKTDQRVLARITDGIYRQPTSALRELISNAYDADATHVVIQTDVPRFSRIIVRDNGNGLTAESLASLIHHIGGSPKRSTRGIEIGVVAPSNPNLSPGGRKLIGKIGIGLFSVSQLTKHFQIITKVKDSKVRLVADILLKTHAEGNISKSANEEFETGDVAIWSVPAEDTGSHGTEIVLLDIHSRIKEDLSSRELWTRIKNKDAMAIPYHAGLMQDNNTTLVEEAKYPWSDGTKPEEKFGEMMQAVLKQVGCLTSNPSLENVFDNYLRMIWNLGLSAPLAYFDKHPFDISGKDNIRIFQLSNKDDSPTEIHLNGKETVRQKLNLSTPFNDSNSKFEVIVDDIKLFRPVKFLDLPMTTNKVNFPIIFFGDYKPNLSDVPEDMRGGDLSFQGYFLWAPKIVPTEHQGILTRIAGATGTLYDESFMKYQVAESTRKRQITGEIYVEEGLEAALNIDRESFNYAHPHYQILTKWTHAALRQVFNKQKRIASDIRTKISDKQHIDTRNKIQKLVRDNTNDKPTPVFFEDKTEEVNKKRSDGALVFNKKIIECDNSCKTSLFEQKITAIAQILNDWGLFENMSYDKQEKLLSQISKILQLDD